VTISGAVVVVVAVVVAAVVAAVVVVVDVVMVISSSITKFPIKQVCRFKEYTKGYVPVTILIYFL